jgi:hypothetical protein
MGCYNSTIINSPIEQVWDRIKNFHNLDWAKGVVEKVDIVGDKKGDEIGAKRVLNCIFVETLIELDPVQHSFKYTIDDGPGPVAKEVVKNYEGHVQLFAVTDANTTLFLWTSIYDSNDPQAVGDLCDPVYRALLKAAKENI